MYAAVIFTLHPEMEELTERFDERHALYVTYSTSKLSKTIEFTVYNTQLIMRLNDIEDTPIEIFI